MALFTMDLTGLRASAIVQSRLETYIYIMEKILSRAEIRLTGWSQPTSSILENDAPFPLYSRRKHPLDSALPPSWKPPSRLPTRSLDILAGSILMYIESNVCRVITLDTFERGKMRASDFSIYQEGEYRENNRWIYGTYVSAWCYVVMEIEREYWKRDLSSNGSNIMIDRFLVLRLSLWLYRMKIAFFFDILSWIYLLI